MNEVMIMRRGGGGGKLFAAIGAEYPAGSTCTCAGKNSGKVLTAKKSPWIFAIPEADEWTVAVIGGSNPSQTVNITHENQVEKVSLGFNLVLFDGGDNTEVSGGWDYDETKQGDGGVNSTSEFSVGSTLYYWAGRDWGAWDTTTLPRKGIVYHKKAVDLTKYTTLTVVSNEEGAELEVCTSQTDGIKKSITLVVGTNTLDVSTLSGNHYICFYNNADSDWAYGIDIAKIEVS